MKLQRIPNTAILVLAALVLVTPIYAGFDPIQFNGNGHYYQISKTLRSWDNAKWAAEQMGGHLATVTSQVENDFITQLLPAEADAWLGGFQPHGSEEPNANWQWVTGEAFTFLNWNGGEPNDGVGWNLTDESSLEIYGVLASGRGKWNDIRPDYGAFPFVIEWDATPPGIPEPGDAPSVVVPEPSTFIAGASLAIAFVLRAAKSWSRRVWFPISFTLLDGSRKLLS